MLPNWSQVSGLVERIIWVALSWALGKGYITSGDATNLATAFLAIAAAVYAYIVNRPSNLLKQAASVEVDGQKTTVVAPAALANALPQPNIVSADSKKVVSK